jgi:hypothetical protein
VADKIPEDIRAWLRECGRSEALPLTNDGAKQLNAVLKGPLFRPIWKQLAERMEGLRDHMMSLEMAKPEEVAKAQALQSEAKGIIVVLETMWEMANVDS